MGRLALVGLAAVAAMTWARWKPFRVAVEGSSMAPTLLPGEYLIAVRPRGRLRHGALVVVEHPPRSGFEMVKRVDQFMPARIGHRPLGASELWVVGDNPARSSDSRAFGPVPASAIRGVVVARYWPPSRLELGTALRRPVSGAGAASPGAERVGR